MILNSCQYLESIQVRCCGYYYLSDKELFEVFVKYSPKNFHKLKLRYNSHSKLLPEELESFFIGWTTRMPQKSLSLTIIYNDSYRVTLRGLDKINGNKEIIEKYIRLGIVKKFSII